MNVSSEIFRGFTHQGVPGETPGKQNSEENINQSRPRIPGLGKAKRVHPFLGEKRWIGVDWGGLGWFGHGEGLWSSEELCLCQMCQMCPWHRDTQSHGMS